MSQLRYEFEVMRELWEEQNPSYAMREDEGYIKWLEDRNREDLAYQINHDEAIMSGQAE